MDKDSSLIVFCPFPPAINQYASDVDRKTFEWAQKFGLLQKDNDSDPAQRTEYGLLAARAYPNSNLEPLQIAADWVSWLFLIDDECDETGIGRNPELLRQLHERLINVLRSATPNETDPPLVHALHDLRIRIAKLASAASLARFIQHVENYFHANRWEAQNRLLGVIPSVATYESMRAHTGAVFACFELFSITDHIDLSPEARQHPTIQGLSLLANCVICWCNDMLSIAKEYHRGDVHNLVIALQNERKLSNLEAMRETVRVHNQTVQEFIELTTKIPSFSTSTDQVLLRYVDCLRHWIRANLDWSLKAMRYKRSVDPDSILSIFDIPGVEK